MIKRSVLFAATVAALSFVAQANADYSVTESNLNPGSSTTQFPNNTAFTFSVPTPNPQTGTDGFAQSFNVINVTEGAPMMGMTAMFTLSETLTIVGTGTTAGSVTGTLSGTFSIMNALSTFTNVTFTQTSGSGFTVGSFTYSPPSPNSTSSNAGNIGVVITPTAVPEPASIAMVGLGLAGVGFTTYRRRRAK